MRAISTRSFAAPTRYPTRTWNKLKKKINKEKEIDEKERQNYFQTLAEYLENEKKAIANRLEGIEELERKEIGNSDKWEKIKNILNQGENLKGADLVYYEAKQQEMRRGIITQTHQIEGREITAYLGIVTGTSVMGMNVISDMFTAFTDFFGGRSGTYERYFEEARENAIDGMAREAKRRGANAVVSVSIDYSPISSQNKSMIMVSAQGTAVVTDIRKNS